VNFALTAEQEAVLVFGETPELNPETGATLVDLLCFAVAGAGKTEIVVRKIRRLVESGVIPQRILLTTFSRRGTADMKRRMALLGVGGAEARTLHALARKLLWDAPEMTRDPQLPPRWVQRQIVTRELRRIARERGLDPNDRENGLPRPSRVNNEITLAKASLIWPGTNADGQWFGPWAASDGVRYPGYSEWATTRKRQPIDAGLAGIVERIYKAVEDTNRAPESARKWDNRRGVFLSQPMFKDKMLTVGVQGRRRGRTLVRFVSFDDMIAMAARCMLTKAPFMERHRGTYCWVFVDECQDNSEGQWVMAKFLASQHLCVIGDDMQAIFGFRGARPDLMHAFAKAPGTKVQPLSSNFRCGQEVLDVANGILEYSGERLYKGSLVCGRGTRAKVTSAFEGTPETEAARVIEEIYLAIKEEGVNPDKVSVLYRINAQSGPLEIEAIKRGLPYTVAGMSFFHRPEIEAAIGYLATALDETDEKGWAACANVPSRMLGEVFFNANPSLVKARESLRNGELGGPGRGFWREGVEAAIRVVAKVKTLLADEGEGVASALRYVFEDAGVRKYFREDGADEETETDVDEACAALVACAQNMTDPMKLIGYARSMARVGHEDVGEREGERTAEPRITLSTVHKAKGLEWDRVYVIGMVDGLFPLLHPDSPQDEAAIEEERRLAYVAMTRARDFLKVTGAKMREDGRLNIPSRFFFEGKLMEAESAEGRLLAAVLGDDDASEDAAAEAGAE
jgi:superfamily I DNA/RNA helicase